MLITCFSFWIAFVKVRTMYISYFWLFLGISCHLLHRTKLCLIATNHRGAHEGEIRWTRWTPWTGLASRVLSHSPRNRSPKRRSSAGPGTVMISDGFTTRFKVWHRFLRILETCVFNLAHDASGFECFAMGSVEDVFQ